MKVTVLDWFNSGKGFDTFKVNNTQINKREIIFHSGGGPYDVGLEGTLEEIEDLLNMWRRHVPNGEGDKRLTMSEPCATCGEASRVQVDALVCHPLVCRKDIERWVKERDDTRKALLDLLHALDMKDVSRPEDKHHDGCVCGPCGRRRDARKILDSASTKPPE